MRDADTTGLEGIYPGVLPVIGKSKKKRASKENAATGSQAAVARAFASQAIAFYFRAPAKAFFRTRLDYLAYARALQQQDAAHISKHLGWMRASTPGLLASAVQHSGWKVIPDHILPPFLANLTVGAITYTSYLQVLSLLHEPSSAAAKRVFPPPSPTETFISGFAAGSIQSIVSSPVDAVQVRYERSNHMATGRQPQSISRFAKEKLREIGLRGVFAGFSLSFLKDSAGCAVFFSVFEYIKSQGYHKFCRFYYGSLHESAVQHLANKRPIQRSTHDDSSHRNDSEILAIKPHFAIEPTFLFLAGLTASLAQSTLIFPLHKIQVYHFDHLEELDNSARNLQKNPQSQHRWRMMRLYYKAYSETWKTCQREAGGKMINWLYRGFAWNTIRSMPSTSAGLIIFELFRRKYGDESDEVHILSKHGEYTIMLQ